MRDVVSKGSRWRIDNWQHVRIWKDNWFPGVAGFKVNIPIRGLDGEAKVGDLIDHDLGIWNREMLKRCFDILVEQQVPSIPLSFRDHAEKLI